MQLVPLRARATCNVCDSKLPPRTEAWWDEETRQATCLTCELLLRAERGELGAAPEPDPAPAPAAVPAASAPAPPPAPTRRGPVLDAPPPAVPTPPPPPRPAPRSATASPPHTPQLPRLVEVTRPRTDVAPPPKPAPPVPAPPAPAAEAPSPKPAPPAPVAEAPAPAAAPAPTPAPVAEAPAPAPAPAPTPAEAPAPTPEPPLARVRRRVPGASRRAASEAGERLPSREIPPVPPLPPRDTGPAAPTETRPQPPEPAAPRQPEAPEPAAARVPEPADPPAPAEADATASTAAVVTPVLDASPTPPPVVAMPEVEAEPEAVSDAATEPAASEPEASNPTEPEPEPEVEEQVAVEPTVDQQDDDRPDPDDDGEPEAVTSAVDDGDLPEAAAALHHDLDPSVAMPAVDAATAEAATDLFAPAPIAVAVPNGDRPVDLMAPPRPAPGSTIHLVPADLLDRGDMGEGRVGQTLEGARVHGLEVVHGLRVEAAMHPIDHLVVAVNGLWVVDAVDVLAGKLERRDEGDWFTADPRLHIGGQDHTALVAAVREKVEAVTRLLARTDFTDIPVRGVLCFGSVQPGWITEPFVLDGVAITWRRKLVEPMLDPVLVDQQSRSALLNLLVGARVDARPPTPAQVPVAEEREVS